MESSTTDFGTVGEDDTIYDDIYDLSHEDNRMYELENMASTQYFKEIRMYPMNVVEMNYFISTMDLVGALKSFEGDNIKTFSPERLDALYLVLKFINLSVVRHCEEMIRNFVMKDFGNLFGQYVMPNIVYDNKESIRAFLEEFYCDTSHYLVLFIKKNYKQKIADSNDDQLLTNTTKAFIKYLSRLLDSEYYAEAISTFKIIFDDAFFSEHFAVFKEIVRNIICYTETSVVPVLTKIGALVEKLMDPDDKEILAKIGEQMDINELVAAESDAVEHFIETITHYLAPEEIEIQKPPQIFEYDNFLYSREHKLDNRKVSFWLNNMENFADDDICDISNFWMQNSSKRISIAKNKAEKIGFVFYPEKCMPNILTPFVVHNFVKEVPDLINLIIKTMQYSRYEPGIFNKYDDIMLETAYMLLAISNEIDTTYDEFLLSMEEKMALPHTYPIEFILRLVSRILNVVINFFDEKMVCNYFDNTLYQMYHDPVNIYQHSWFEYYLLQPKDVPFMPVTENRTDIISNKNITNRKKKIVEV